MRTQNTIFVEYIVLFKCNFLKIDFFLQFFLFTQDKLYYSDHMKLCEFVLFFVDCTEGCFNI